MVEKQTQQLIDNVVNRRAFLTGATMFGLGAATSAVVMGCGGSSKSVTPVSAATATDTATNIFTAALIAESLAITTYYTALSSPICRVRCLKRSPTLSCCARCWAWRPTAAAMAQRAFRRPSTIPPEPSARSLDFCPCSSRSRRPLWARI